MLFDDFNRGALPVGIDQFEAELLSVGWTDLKAVEMRRQPPLVTILGSPDGSRVARLRRGSDQGFAVYAGLALNNPNPHLQTIHWHGFLPGGHVAVMDRLYPWQKVTNLPSHTKYVIRKMIEIDYFVSGSPENDVWLDDVLPDYRERKLNARNLRSVMTQLNRMSPSLHDAYVLLERHALEQSRIDGNFNCGSPNIETNDDNIMVRPAGAEWIVVLSDPYCYPEEAIVPLSFRQVLPFRTVFEKDKKFSRPSSPADLPVPVLAAHA